MPLAPMLQRHVQLHTVVVLLGFTAILGALITLSAIDLVWYRTDHLVGH